MTREANIVSFDDARDERRRSTSARSTPARSTSRSRSRTRSRVSDVTAERARSSARSDRHREPAENSRDKRKRERTKAKADRMFAKQFAFESSSDAAAQEEGAPRAALYEGRMGSKHRKSARMQRSGSAGEMSAKINPVGWLSAIPLTARTLKIGTAVLCMFLVCAFLYTPARQYYQAQRELDRLSVEYGIIEDRNEALDVQNDILASDAGMEDAVRQKYGYVKTGEQVAVVSGLSDETTDTSRDGDSIEANVLSSTVRAPEEWYTPFLDTFFGVD